MGLPELSSITDPLSTTLHTEFAIYLGGRVDGTSVLDTSAYLQGKVRTSGTSTVGCGNGDPHPFDAVSERHKLWFHFFFLSCPFGSP